MKIGKLLICATIALTIGGCDAITSEEDKAVNLAGREMTPTAAKFAKDSNGRWESSQNDLQVYVSMGSIDISRFEEGKIVGQITGTYKPNMEPNTRESVMIDTATEELSGVKSVALVSNNQKLSIQIDSKAYDLTRPKPEKAEAVQIDRPIQNDEDPEAENIE